MFCTLYAHAQFHINHNHNLVNAVRPAEAGRDRGGHYDPWESGHVRELGGAVLRQVRQHFPHEEDGPGVRSSTKKNKQQWAGGCG